MDARRHEPVGRVVTTEAPAKYHYHELKKLLGDYEPTANMPCWRCDEPEGLEITFRLCLLAGAAWPKLPPGTMPATDALLAPAPATRVEPAEPGVEPTDTLSDLFSLRDYVISEATIMAAAIKAAGGLRTLARKLGVRQEAIEQWQRVPVERLQAVAKATGLPQHVLRPDLFDVGEPLLRYTKEEEDEMWKWSHARQLWLPLPYPPGFLPKHCCANRPRLTLVGSK